MQQLANDPTFTPQEMKQAGFFIGAGVAAYCPRYDSQVTALANGG